MFNGIVDFLIPNIIFSESTNNNIISDPDPNAANMPRLLRGTSGAKEHVFHKLLIGGAFGQKRSTCCSSK
jgi:hypothetical protein